jgi:hypothetical protein
MWKRSMAFFRLVELWAVEIMRIQPGLQPGLILAIGKPCFDLMSSGDHYEEQQAVTDWVYLKWTIDENSW